jgi:hypothetical protein
VRGCRRLKAAAIAARCALFERPDARVEPLELRAHAFKLRAVGLDVSAHLEQHDEQLALFGFIVCGCGTAGTSHPASADRSRELSHFHLCQGRLRARIWRTQV